MNNNYKGLDIKNFIYLMLSTLANNSKITNELNEKVAYLPYNYKQIIENIIYAENKWKEIFSNLIDIDEYLDDHFEWELIFSKTLIEVLNNLNKQVSYDIINDRLLISFKQEEIDLIMNKYQDVELKNHMIQFTSLLTDYIYTREFQEEFYDYSASTIKRVKELRKDYYYQKSCEIMGASFSEYVKNQSQKQNIETLKEKNILNFTKKRTRKNKRNKH